MGILLKGIFYTITLLIPVKYLSDWLGYSLCTEALVLFFGYLIYSGLASIEGQIEQAKREIRQEIEEIREEIRDTRADVSIIETCIRDDY